MKPFNKALIFARMWLVVSFFLMPVLSMAAEDENLGEAMVNPGYFAKPDWFKASFLVLEDDLQEAAADGKDVMILFHQDGCPYCKKLLEVNFTDPAIVKKLKAHFDVIEINMWGDREVTLPGGREMTEKTFASALKVMFTPTIIIMDEKGQSIVRMNGYYQPDKFMAVLNYVADDHYTSQSFQEYMAKYSQPGNVGVAVEEAAAVDLLSLAESGKPVLIVFDENNCPACDEMKQIFMEREPITKKLQQFNLVRLNLDNNAPVVYFDGTTTTVSELAATLKINYSPSLIFFDRVGNAEMKEVFRSEAYLRSFHIESLLDYVKERAWISYPEFQRYVQKRADDLHAQGIEFDLMD